MFRKTLNGSVRIKFRIRVMALGGMGEGKGHNDRNNIIVINEYTAVWFSLPDGRLKMYQNGYYDVYEMRMGCTYYIMHSRVRVIRI